MRRHDILKPGEPHIDEDFRVLEVPDTPLRVSEEEVHREDERSDATTTSGALSTSKTQSTHRGAFFFEDMTHQKL